MLRTQGSLRAGTLSRVSFGVLLVLVLPVRSTAETRRVPTAEYPFIPDAINASADGDTVLLAAGVYAEPENRHLDFGGRNLVLQGTEPAEPCVIDCSWSGGIYLVSSETSPCAIRGLTIRRGGSPLLAGTGEEGAGLAVEPRPAIYCRSSAPLIEACTITESLGRGILVESDAAPVLVDCLIQEGDGPGIEALSPSSLTMTSCTVVNNEQEGIRGSGAFSLRECRVTGNGSSANPGGLRFRAGASASLNDCTVNENQGGGILIESGVVRCTLDGCAITGNTGSGVRVGSAEAVISDCVISGNQGTAGGGIHCLASPLVENCRITGNLVSGSGGGIACTGSSPTLRGCTISGNRAAGGSGGGIYTEALSSPTVEETIVWGNEALSADNGPEIFALSTGTLTLICTIARPGAGFGPGTITGSPYGADPMFCEPRPAAEAPFTDGDYRVDAASLALADHNDCREDIGSLGIGCGDSPAERSSWGRIKAGFRRAR